MQLRTMEGRDVSSTTQERQQILLLKLLRLESCLDCACLQTEIFLVAKKSYITTMTIGKMFSRIFLGWLNNFFYNDIIDSNNIFAINDKKK